MGGEEVALRLGRELTTPGDKTAGGRVECRDSGEVVRSNGEPAVFVRFVQTVGEPGAILLAPPRPEVGMALLEESLSDLDVHVGLLLRG